MLPVQLKEIAFDLTKPLLRLELNVLYAGHWVSMYELECSAFSHRYVLLHEA